MKRKKLDIYQYFFVMPAVLYMLLLIGYPIIYNIIISFQDVTNLTLASSHRVFIGSENYRQIFLDKTLHHALQQTFLYTVGCLIFQFSIGFLLALFFSKEFVGAKTSRGIIVISWMLPVTVTALIWKFMLGEGNGIINYILLSLKIIKNPIGWLINGNTAMAGLIMTNSWVGIPFNMILLTTGLTAIDKTIYEAANIDGASKFQQLIHLTIPLLKQTMLSVLILGFVYTFKVFDLVWVMTGGGPVDATEVMSTYAYKKSFILFQLGQGAAAANILFVILFIVAICYVKSTVSENINK